MDSATDNFLEHVFYLKKSAASFKNAALESKLTQTNKPLNFFDKN